MKKYTLVIVLCIALGINAEIYNFARLDNTHGLSNNQVECVFKDSRGFMWIGTNFGLNRYDGNQIKVYRFIRNDSTSLLYNEVSHIQEDVNGDLWITGIPNSV